MLKSTQETPNLQANNSIHVAFGETPVQSTYLEEAKSLAVDFLDSFTLFFSIWMSMRM